ncbi:unnamed protein product [Rhizophagus irregularis]|nr:unnamed protein product [Rhizophagus irregularis]
MVFRFSSSESQEMGLSVFVFGKSGNGSFSIRLRKVGKWASGVLISGNEEPKGLFGVFNLEKRNGFTVPDVRMMETTGSGRLDNGNRNEPECRMKLRPRLW